MQVKSINKTVHSSQKPMAQGSKNSKATPSPKAMAMQNMKNKMQKSAKYQPSGKPAGAGKSNSVVMKGNSVTGKGSGYKSKMC